VRNTSQQSVPRTRIFLETEAGTGDRVELPAAEARHIFKVLRAREGEAVEAVTPGRRLLLAGVYGDYRRARAEVIRELPVPRGPETRVTLYQAVPKGKHMDLVAEKATELGVRRIVPLLTEHGEVEPSDEKLDRWRRIAEAAARQSLQLRVPAVSEPERFREALESLAETESGVLLHNEAGLPTLEEAVSAGGAALFVGPEGGWSGQELDQARERGLEPAQMGPYRLRAETAGVVAVARAESRLRSLAADTGEAT